MSATIAERIEISAADFVSMLYSVRGATMVSFIASTEPRLKAGNPFPGLRKITKIGGVLNFNYAAAVNRQREREGMTPDFVAESRKWGQRVEGTPIVTHNGKFYVEAKVERSEIMGYIMPDLSVVDENEVAKWLPNRHSGRQHVEKAIVLRDFAVENIRSMRIKGGEYVID
jgi:hypothetical protein